MSLNDDFSYANELQRSTKQHIQTHKPVPTLLQTSDAYDLR